MPKPPFKREGYVHQWILIVCRLSPSKYQRLNLIIAMQTCRIATQSLFSSLCNKLLATLTRLYVSLPFLSGECFFHAPPYSPKQPWFEPCPPSVQTLHMREQPQHSGLISKWSGMVSSSRQPTERILLQTNVSVSVRMSKGRYCARTVAASNEVPVRPVWPSAAADS